MAYKLTKAEMETIVVFNEAENTASISTFNGLFIRRLTALCAEQPDETTCEGPSSDGEYVFTVPKSRIRISAGKKISAERRQALSDQGRDLGKKNAPKG